MHTTTTRFTSVRCTYRSTLDCILEVSARELSSGSEAQITISEAMRLGEEEVERMVRESLVDEKRQAFDDEIAKRVASSAPLDAPKSTTGSAAAAGQLWTD